MALSGGEPQTPTLPDWVLRWSDTQDRITGILKAEYAARDCLQFSDLLFRIASKGTTLASPTYPHLLPPPNLGFTKPKNRLLMGRSEEPTSTLQSLKRHY